MTTTRRRWWMRGAVVLGVAVAVALPGTANASVALPNSVPVNGSTAPQDYTFATINHFWSIVAVQPAAGDVDLSLFVVNGREPLATSTQGTGKTDFVGINSNTGFRPLGNYKAVVSLYSGSPSHAIEQEQGNFVINLPIPANDGVSGASDPDINFAVLGSADVATVMDLYLTAGQKFWAHTTVAGNSLYLLESNPANPATFVRSRAQANTATHAIVDGCTLYTAQYTGWHGVAMVDDRMPAAPGSGTAFALHRWNPAKPTTCPVKNFPGPTPA